MGIMEQRFKKYLASYTTSSGRLSLYTMNYAVVKKHS